MRKAAEEPGVNPSTEVQLQVATAMLGMMKQQGATAEAVAFWERVVAELEEDTRQERLMEKAQ